MGDVPKVKFRYKVEDLVYFTAYPKKNPDCFFTCKGIIKTITVKNGRPVYRVQIHAVGAKPVLCQSKAEPKHLLEKIVTKRENELTKHLSPLMTPKKWIE